MASKKGKPKETNVAVDRPGAIAPAEEAYTLLSPRYGELKPADFAKMNLDVPRAVSLVLGSLPRIELLIADMEEALKKPPTKQIKELKSLALGAWYAHLLDTPTTSESEKGKLLEEGSKLRVRLLNAAAALADAGLFDPKVVENIRKGSGNIDKANDLVALAALFTQNWVAIESKTAITAQQVEQAATIGPALLVSLSERPLMKQGATSETRVRAFTLLNTSYDAIRRAVDYVRWDEGDAELIAPSLYTKGKRKRGANEEGGDEEEPVDEGTDEGSDEDSPEG